ncbi:MAG: hypothetical protein R2708_26540 [Vicinamibacterales bacterium]
MARLARSAVAVSAVAALALVAPGLAAQTDDYPHAFPRQGVTQILDNVRVTVWEVNWRHGDRQPVHRHKYDMAGVYLRWGPITVTDLDGKENKGAEFPVPRPYFQPKGITHREEAVTPGAPERLAIMVDLKESVTDMMMIDDPEPSAYPRDGATNVLENRRIRMWDYTYAPGGPAVKRVYRNDVVEVVVTGGTVTVTGPDGRPETRTLAPKQARYINRGTVVSEQGASGSPRVIAIELK